MQTTRVAVCLAVIIPLIGTEVKPGPSNQANLLAPSAGENPQRRELRGDLTRIAKEFHAGNYIEAENLYQQGYHRSQTSQETDLAARFVWGAGSCRLAIHHSR